MQEEPETCCDESPTMIGQRTVRRNPVELRFAANGFTVRGGYHHWQDQLVSLSLSEAMKHVELLATEKSLTTTSATQRNNRRFRLFSLVEVENGYVVTLRGPNGEEERVATNPNEVRAILEGILA